MVSEDCVYVCLDDDNDHITQQTSFNVNLRKVNWSEAHEWIVCIPLNELSCEHIKRISTHIVLLLDSQDHFYSHLCFSPLFYYVYIIQAYVRLMYDV